MRLFSPGPHWWASMVSGCLLAVGPVAAQSPPAETPSVAVAGPTISPAASPAERGRVLYPVNGPQPSPGTVRGPGEPAGLQGLATSFLVLLALCAGGYYLVRRQAGFTPVGKGQRRLVVSESRSLGNRQFLVVVEYDKERILLGVTPGKIDYLCPLPMATADAGPAREGTP